jgi:transposase
MPITTPKRKTLDETSYRTRHLRDHGHLHRQQPRRNDRAGDERATDPDAIFGVLEPYGRRLHLVSHEAGSLSPWLQPELVRLGLPAVCLETRHVRAAMSAQRNKTDAANALGIAHIMRTGWFRSAQSRAPTATGCGCC